MGTIIIQESIFFAKKSKQNHFKTMKSQISLAVLLRCFGRLNVVYPVCV